MKHMAELQLSVVTDHETKQPISNQIIQWEKNLERSHCEQFRLRCYMASLQNSELPNPKVSHVFLGYICGWFVHIHQALCRWSHVIPYMASLIANRRIWIFLTNVLSMQLQIHAIQPTRYGPDLAWIRPGDGRSGIILAYKNISELENSFGKCLSS